MKMKISFFGNDQWALGWDNGHWDGYGIGHWDWDGNWDNGRGQWVLGWKWEGMGQWDPSHSQRQVYVLRIIHGFIYP